MASCKRCGTWAGVANDEHVGCAEMAANGWTNEQITAELKRQGQSPAAAPVPLSFRHIVGGVWLGTILAGLTLGILYALIHSIF